MIDLQITNISGYNGLCVNFSAKDLTKTIFGIEIGRAGFNYINQQVIWDNVVVGTVSRSVVLEAPTYNELLNIKASNGGQTLEEMIEVKKSASMPFATSAEIIHINGSVEFEFGVSDIWESVCCLSAVVAKHRNQADYSIVSEGNYGKGTISILTGVYEKDSLVYRVPFVVKRNDIFGIERRGDTISYLCNGKAFYTSKTKSTANLYFSALIVPKNARVDKIQVNRDVYGDLTIKFNERATEHSVESITKAINYQGIVQDISLSVTNSSGLKSATTLIIKAPNALSLPVLSGTIPAVSDSTLFEKCPDLSITHEGIYDNLHVLFKTAHPQFAHFAIGRTSKVTFETDTRKVLYNGVTIGAGNTVADMAKQGLIITFNSTATEEGVEAVTRAVSVDFPADAQDVMLSLTNAKGDKSATTLTIPAPSS
jgi:hypothetical protein